MPRRVGIIGYGNLGRFLVSKIIKDEQYELAFVWNRTRSVLEGVLESCTILDDICNFASKEPDIVVEVAHPSVTKSYGKLILKYCDFMIGSPTALIDDALFQDLLNAATIHGLYIPSGAFWGSEDIRKLSDFGMLKV